MLWSEELAEAFGSLPLTAQSSPVSWKRGLAVSGYITSFAPTGCSLCPAFSSFKNPCPGRSLGPHIPQ